MGCPKLYATQFILVVSEFMHKGNKKKSSILDLLWEFNFYPWGFLAYGTVLILSLLIPPLKKQLNSYKKPDFKIEPVLVLAGAFSVFFCIALIPILSEAGIWFFIVGFFVAFSLSALGLTYIHELIIKWVRE